MHLIPNEGAAVTFIARSRFLAAAAASLAVAPRAVRAQGKPLSIGYVPSTLFAPVFVAVERGFVREAGLTANLTPIVAGQDAMALVAQGQLDCVTAGLSAAFFNGVNRGLEVKFVASTGYQPKTGHPTALMMREDEYDAGAHTPAALRGKTVGWLGNAGATAGYYVARILRGSGLKMSDINPVSVAASDQQVALERKAVDAMFSSAPFTALFEQRKLARIIGSVQPGISGTGIFFGPTLLHDIPTAANLMRAFRKGAELVAGHGYYDAQNLAAMAKYTQQPVDLIRTTDRYDFKPDLRIDYATLLDMQNEFVSQGILAYKTPLNEVRLIAKF
jgi:NitT/TauT family transport system substrate-binding protein